MSTYSLNTSYEAIENVVNQLTEKGRETMRAVGAHELSFFDGGIVENEGIWGECLVSEMGHKSSGVVNRLKELGLWVAQEDEDDVAGMWWSLTALGADVANFLAGNLENQTDADTQMNEELAEPVQTTTGITVKEGRKWSYIYVDGEQVMEVRSHLLEQVLKTINFA